MFHTRIDMLMIGCLAAFLLDSPSWRQRIRKIPVAPVLLASSIFLLMIGPTSLVTAARIRCCALLPP